MGEESSVIRVAVRRERKRHHRRVEAGGGVEVVDGGARWCAGLRRHAPGVGVVWDVRGGEREKDNRAWCTKKSKVVSLGPL